MLISEILFASRYYNFNFRIDKVFTQDIHKTKTLNEFLGLKKTYWIMFFYLHTHTNTHPKEPQILLLPSLSSPASIPFLSLLSLCSCCLYTFSSSHSILNPLYSGICLYHFSEYELAEVTSEAVINTLLNPKVGSHASLT